MQYKTENESVVEYITNLKLEDYIGPYAPKDVIVLADSGYDDKKFENAIARKKWKFIIALNKTRSVKTQTRYWNTAFEQLISYKKKEFDWPEYEKRFNDLLKVREAHTLVSSSELHMACLLCSEPTPEKCQRRLVAEYLTKHFDNIVIRHL